jgi:hypothetical protein
VGQEITEISTTAHPRWRTERESSFRLNLIPYDPLESATLGIRKGIQLAMFDNYPLTRKNSRFDLHILRGHLWGGRFQMSVMENPGSPNSGGAHIDFGKIVFIF